MSGICEIINLDGERRTLKALELELQELGKMGWQMDRKQDPSINYWQSQQKRKLDLKRYKFENYLSIKSGTKVYTIFKVRR